nr:uncharacterized protein LOC115863723 isoform X2 [Globicephala melas]
MPGEPGSPTPAGWCPPVPASSVTPAPVHPPVQSAALLAVSAASAASASSTSSHRLITLSSAVAPHCGRGPGRGPPRPPPPSPAAGAPSDARARARARGRRRPGGQAGGVERGAWEPLPGVVGRTFQLPVYGPPRAATAPRPRGPLTAPGKAAGRQRGLGAGLSSAKRRCSGQQELFVVVF